MQGQELDFIDPCVSFPTQDILLFTCSRFCHSPLTVLSHFQELLCIVFVLEQELHLPGFWHVFFRCQICSCQLTALCWKPLPSCTLRQRTFPVFLSVLVLHHSNVSTLLPAAGTKLQFWLLSVNLKSVTLMFEGSSLSDFAKAIWFMA